MIPKPACTIEPMKQNHSEGVEAGNFIFNNFKGDDYAQLNFEPLLWIMTL